MTDLRIRAATPDDLDAVLAFWKVAAEGTSISDDRGRASNGWSPATPRR